MRNYCKFRGLIQFWHTITAIIFQSVVLFRSFQNYLLFRSQVLDTKHGLDWDERPLDLYVNCLVISSTCTIFMTFLLFADRDNIVLGDSHRNYFSQVNETECSYNADIVTDSILPKKRQTYVNYLSSHFPVAFIFHVLAAYSLLLPIPWITGERARNEAILPGLVWQTDLSFMFPMMSASENMRSAHLNRPELAQLASEVLQKTPTGSRLGIAALLALQPPSLGGLGQLPQTYDQERLASELKLRVFNYIQRSEGPSSPAIAPSSPGSLFFVTPPPPPLRTAIVDTEKKTRPVSPEFVNYLLSLIFLSIRVASAFWSTWPTFSYVSSVILIGTSIYLAFEFAAVTLLVQLLVCLAASDGGNRVDLTLQLVANASHYRYLLEDPEVYSKLVLVRLPVHLQSWQMLWLTAFALLVTLLEVVILFHVSVRQFYKALRANQYTITRLFNMVEQGSSGQASQTFPGLINRPYDEFTPKAAAGWSAAPPPDVKDLSASTRPHRHGLCYSLKRHQSRKLRILGFLLFALATLIRVPFLIDLFNVYWQESEYLCMTVLVLFVVVHLAWLMLWFSFAVKQKWCFRLECPSPRSSSISVQYQQPQQLHRPPPCKQSGEEQQRHSIPYTSSPNHDNFKPSRQQTVPKQCRVSLDSSHLIPNEQAAPVYPIQGSDTDVALNLSLLPPTVDNALESGSTYVYFAPTRMRNDSHMRAFAPPPQINTRYPEFRQNSRAVRQSDSFRGSAAAATWSPRNSGISTVPSNASSATLRSPIACAEEFASSASASVPCKSTQLCTHSTTDLFLQEATSREPNGLLLAAAPITAKAASASEPPSASHARAFSGGIVFLSNSLTLRNSLTPEVSPPPRQSPLVTREKLCSQV